MSFRAKLFDTAEYLDSPEMIAAYLDAILEERDPALFAKAVGDIARAIGMAKIAKDAGLSREGLYKSLGENGNPTLETLTKVFGAMGLKLTVEPAEQKEFA